MKHPKIGIRPTIDGRQGGVRESLEEKTMTLAANVAALISSNLRYTDGTPVECVIADGTIGRVAESAACAEKFEREGVGGTITVTSCWCYGSETMDMNPYWPKAVWGFNGTERPGAVYLAAVLAAHAQKGLPAFGIYGHDVQDLDDNSIPEDVAEKILRFARGAVAVAEMRGESYLSIGSVTMGIAGSIVDTNFFQKYLGMRNESVDEVEILRRMDLGIYDPEEFEKAMAWVKKYCMPNEGWDKNPEGKQKTREQKDKDWEFVVKMTIIVMDLMHGNPKLREMGFKEEALGHNAIAGGFQGQRQWTDWMPNGDFTETLLNTNFDWNGRREPSILATENDSLNGTAMLMAHLLTNRPQIFSDVRTYWSPEAVKRVTGKELTGKYGQTESGTYWGDLQFTVVDDGFLRDMVLTEGFLQKQIARIGVVTQYLGNHRLVPFPTEAGRNTFLSQPFGNSLIAVTGKVLVINAADKRGFLWNDLVPSVL